MTTVASLELLNVYGAIADDPVDLRGDHLTHFYRAFRVLGTGLSTPPKPDSLVDFIELMQVQIVERSLPPILLDFLVHASAMRTIEQLGDITTPNVESLTPYLRVRGIHFVTKYPIDAFLAGKVDDPFMISARHSHYFLFRDTLNGASPELLSVHHPKTFTRLLQHEPLATILSSADEVDGCLSYLVALSRAGLVAWLRPSPCGLRKDTQE